ncbi:Uncharacterised protein [Vibrio cholerae]|nr:Uncharacterised protein [Vibrio cholerae]CSI77307.1 Uncharacterised protein [Vibrio cholerae]
MALFKHSDISGINSVISRIQNSFNAAKNNRFYSS